MIESTRRQRVPGPAVLLVVLAITTGWVQAAAPRDRTFIDEKAHAARVSAAAPAFAPVRDAISLASRAARADEVRVTPDASVVAPPVERPAEPAKAPISKDGDPRVPKPVAHAFSGVNRFWIPSLGISYPVHLFECPRKRPPDNYMYRWGCAGTNNVYILGHAHSVMKPLHDAFEAGRLRVGMIAVYADGKGRIRSYRVTEWRVVDPVDVHWAIASQPVPSMTLQTCVGKDGVDRLNVRLVATD